MIQFSNTVILYNTQSYAILTNDVCNSDPVQDVALFLI